MSLVKTSNILSLEKKVHHLDSKQVELQPMKDTSTSGSGLKVRCDNGNSTDSEAEDSCIEIEVEDSSSCDSTHFETKYHHFEQIKEEDEIEDVPNINVEQIKMETEHNSLSKDNNAIPTFNRISIEHLKIEKGLELESNVPISKGKSYTILVANHNKRPKYEEENSDIEIKIVDEDCADINSESEEENVYFEIEIEDSDHGDLSTEDEYSKVANCYEKAELYSTFVNPCETLKNETNITNQTSKTENLQLEHLEIKEKPDSEKEDMKHKDEFMARLDVFSEFGEKNSNLHKNIDKKKIILELIQEYHRRPQLWHEQLSSRFSSSQKNNMLQSITDALNSKFNMHFKVDRIRIMLYLLCKQYFEEKENHSNVQEKRRAENTNLWFYNKMRFLKNQNYNKLKLELVISTSKDEPSSTFLELSQTIVKETNITNPSFTTENIKPEPLEIKKEQDSEKEEMEHKDEFMRLQELSYDFDEDNTANLTENINKKDIFIENVELEPLKIKKEPDSEKEDMEHKNKFQSHEELFSEFGEKNSANMIDKKRIVLELIQEYHRRPQLWHEQLSCRFNTSQKNNMLQSLTDALNSKFNMKLKVDLIKAILFLMSKQYLEEKERRSNANEERRAKNSNLWFYDKMSFLKNTNENKLKLNLVISSNMDESSSSFLELPQTTTENIKLEPLEIKEEPDSEKESMEHNDEYMRPEVLSSDFYEDAENIQKNEIGFENVELEPLEIKEEADSENEDMESHEDLFSDIGEINSANVNENIDKNKIVLELIQEYHRRPQLWHEQISPRFNTSQKNNMLQSITDALNAKFNMRFKVDRIKIMLFLICKQYLEEKERQSHAKEDNPTSNLWFYDKMRFLKNPTQNKLKIDLDIACNVIQLNENILGNIIEIYKTFEDLWKLSYFGTVKRYLMQLMCNEIKNKMRISLNVFNLENIIFDIHTKYSIDKRRRYKCEVNQMSFEPSFSHFYKCDFLEDYQGPFKCLNCCQIIESYHKFKVHISQHDGRMPFKCDICGKVCDNQKNLDYHNSRHNPRNNNCTFCGKRFYHPIILKMHIETNHHEKLKCKICKELFINKRSLNLHMSLHEDKNINCKICGKGFCNPQRLKVHHDLIHVKSKFQCKVCGIVCKNHSTLKYHSYRHNGNKYRCYFCKKNFSHPNNLYNHMQKHDKNKFECNFCGNRYSLKASLTAHEKRCWFRS